MNNRIKQLREEYLKLSQDAFGDILGVSQRTVSTFESDAKKLTDRNFNAICREFNVNPSWLKDGVGEMFLNPSTLDKLAAEYDLTPDETALIKTFAELPAADRQVIIRLVQNFAHSLGVKLPDEDRKPDDQLTAAEKLKIATEELNAEAAGEKEEQKSLRSIGSSGLRKSKKLSS